MVKEFVLEYHSKPGILKTPNIPIFKYQKMLSEEIKEGNVTRQNLLEFLEQMLMIRIFEQMLLEIVAGIYEPLKGYKYIGSTHLSIGQEATSVGSISAINSDSYITSSHRGHCDVIAKGYNFIKSINSFELIGLLKKTEKYVQIIGEDFNEGDSRLKLEEIALKIHIYRIIAEVFGKADGYCRGLGGGMHIANLEFGHLGSNAIVGGHIGIAVGAAMSNRYQENHKQVLCLAGDGAYSNGIAHEAIGLATMSQFKNGLMKSKFGVPIIFGVVNNQYALSGQENGEITGIDYIARKATGYDLDAMHAEVVDGMNIMAVFDAIKRSSIVIKEGKGPVLLEFLTYRYKGHSLSDPLTYRNREELEIWQQKDPINSFISLLLKANFTKKQGGKINKEEIDLIKEKSYNRNTEMAVLAASSKSPAPETLLSLVISKKKYVDIPNEFKSPKIFKPIPVYKRNENGKISFRIAVREALIEEMKKDGRLLLFGEDVADYGGIFGVTNEILNIFGRDRVFNTPISESGIVGTAIGMAMTGLKPIIEIMYNDFILQAMDQIANQAAKWHYMTGGQVNIPMVIRTVIGAGRGYAGQHSQSLEAIVAHIPGLIVIAPSSPYDAKGLLKSAISEENPVIFFEHQLIYNNLGIVPEQEYSVPIGKAKIIKEGTDVTVICWSYMVSQAIEASEILESDGISTEIIDLRTLIPLDIDTIVNSIKKTGRAVVTSQEVIQNGFCAEIISQIQDNIFDWLDGPIKRLGAPNGVTPYAQNLEKLFLPDSEKLIDLIKNMLH
jgi:2-oxoisovalerate dehydrogenase E1 component